MLRCRERRIRSDKRGGALRVARDKLRIGASVRKSDEERDAWRERAEAAEKTLEGFDGIDIETMNRELADWKRKAEEQNRKAFIYKNPADRSLEQHPIC